MAHPAVTLTCAVALALYLWGLRRVSRRRAAPRGRVLCFALGVAVAAAALGDPIDAYADAWFVWHMVQHLLLALVSAPLLLLGAPLLLARQAAPPWLRRPLDRALRGRVVGALTFPVVSWALFVAVMWGSHYSGLYEVALEHPLAHALEHALYLTSALLFWLPVVGIEPSRWRLGHAPRLLYLFLAAGQNAFLGASLYESGRVLYPHYAEQHPAQGAALADQQFGGEAMWIVGSLVTLVAVLLVVAAWMRHEERVARRREAVEDAAAGRAPAGG